MRSRLVKPETARIPISDGDWILVKRRLTAGEARRVQARMIKSMNAGERVQLDPIQVGRSQAMEYLLDWSLDDCPIRGCSPEQIGEMLDSIDGESFAEILHAIQAHEAAVEKARVEEKNDRDGAINSSVISPSAA